MPVAAITVWPRRILLLKAARLRLALVFARLRHWSRAAVALRREWSEVPIGTRFGLTRLRLRIPGLRRRRISARLCHWPCAAIILRRERAEVAVPAIGPGFGLARLRLEASRLRLSLISARLLDAAVRWLGLTLNTRVAVAIAAEAVPSGASLLVRLRLRVATRDDAGTSLRIRLRLNVAARRDAGTSGLVHRNTRVLAEGGRVACADAFTAVCTCADSRIGPARLHARVLDDTLLRRGAGVERTRRELRPALREKALVVCR